MYAKVWITRQMFWFFDWQFSVSEGFFIGPFENDLQEKYTRFLLDVLIKNFAYDFHVRHMVIYWKKCDALPKGAKSLEPSEALEVLYCDLVEKYLPL